MKPAQPVKLPQPWLHSARVDSALILAPALLATLIVAVFYSPSDDHRSVPVWMWVAVVLCCDVAHVYATLFRTYFDAAQFARHRTLLVSAPLFTLLGSIVLYSLSADWFWRVLAYIAVFHFVRQQYGFLQLYARNAPPLSRTDALAPWSATIDRVTIYMATLYPLVYWHTKLPRQFHWFVDGDFISGLSPLAAKIAGLVYIVALGTFAADTLLTWHAARFVNLPRLLLVIGTAASWYLGIVWFNGDIAFTVTNVITHGVPYMALVWIYQQHAQQRRPSHSMAATLLRIWPLYIGVLILLAYGEESLWNALVWREFDTLFGITRWLPQVSSQTALAVIVPLLSLPQLTHYVLDGFIWKRTTPATPANDQTALTSAR